MNFISALMLGALQGLTEFLPVSSSGHLVLAQHFLKVREAGLFYDVMLHVGTLLATVWVFRRDIGALLRSLIGNPAGDGPEWLATGTATGTGGSGWKYVAFIIVGTIPAALVGGLFEDQIENLFHAPQFVCVNLFITGAILLAASLKGRGESLIVKSGWLVALLIGCAQALAIAPGISRSGATIVAALLLGAGREEATRFSFLLSIPAILGAAALGAKDLSAAEVSGLALPVAVGCAAAFAAGIAALHIVVAAVRGRRLAVFAPYCWVVAVAGLIGINYL
ncbi:MAG: undecaprenyl-diphosphate phosphatase [bacterium]